MRNIRAFVLVGLLVFVAGYKIQTMMNPHLKLANKNIRVTVILYSNIQDTALLSQELNSFLCEARGCFSAIIKSVLESEFRRHTGKFTKFSISVIPPQGGQLFDVNFPANGFQRYKFLYKLYSEFRKRGVSYWSSDIRLYVNISKYDPKKYEETSLATSNLRAGFIQWDIGNYKNMRMWNITKTVHEIGHVLGAADKYNEAAKSLFPDGYVSPERGPHAAQDYVEIMSGTRPTGDANEAEATDESQLRFGKSSAFEMGWIPFIPHTALPNAE